jgi:serpin B
VVVDVRRLVAASLSVATWVTGCADSSGSADGRRPPQGAASEVAASDLEDPQPLGVEPSAASSLNAFDLHRALSATDHGNTFYSPASVALVLAAIHDGAAGETAEELAAALHVSGESVTDVYGGLAGSLAGSSAAFRVHSASRLWHIPTMEILPAYVDTLAKHHQADIAAVDWRTDKAQAERQIGAWISEHTEGRVHQPLANVLSSRTRAVFTNAVRFDARWETAFGGVTDAQFHVTETEEIPVRMMWGTPAVSFVQSDDLTAVDIPYRGGFVSMLVLMPPLGQLPALEASLTPARVTEIVDSMQRRTVHVSLPEFSIATESLSLREALQSLGVTTAFSDNADLTKMTRAGGLYVADVLHGAQVDVDKDGTRVAALTVAPIHARGRPRDSVKVDRPFVFLIRDRASGAIVFMGRMVGPVGPVGLAG